MAFTKRTFEFLMVRDQLTDLLLMCGLFSFYTPNNETVTISNLEKHSRIGLSGTEKNAVHHFGALVEYQGKVLPAKNLTIVADKEDPYCYSGTLTIEIYTPSIKSE